MPGFLGVKMCLPQKLKQVLLLSKGKIGVTDLQ